MSISKDAVEAGLEAFYGRKARVWLKMERDEMERALTAALPFLARPAPSQSDEERAANLEKYARYSTKADSEEMKVVYLRALAAVRAEATLAGAAAERERIAEWLYAEEDEKELAAAIRRMKP